MHVGMKKNNQNAQLYYFYKKLSKLKIILLISDFMREKYHIHFFSFGTKKYS